jgi:hypothetical protein
MVKIQRLLGVLLFGLLCSALLRADTTTQNDPGVDWSDPFCGELQPCPTPIFAGQGITFTTNANGLGIFQGTNEYSGTDHNTWDSLLITFSNPLTESGSRTIPFSEISCTSGEFGGQPYESPCSISQDPNDPNVTDLVYQDCPTCDPTNGIFPDDIFTIHITAAFASGVSFKVYPNQDTSITDFVPLQDTRVPEPATLALFGSGFLAVFARVRRSKAR